VPIGAALACAGALCAVSLPQPPCGADPVPPFAAPDAPPAVQVWNSADFPPGWKPSPCTAWESSDSATIVALAARFAFAGGVDGLRRKIGAVSETKGLLYWSATRKKWQTLILDAYAATGPEGGQRRADFAAGEIVEGRTLFFEQQDNLFGNVLYRMRIRSASARRLVIEIENAAAVRYLTVTLFEPGQLQSAYFLEQEGPALWSYYAIVRSSGRASALLPGHEASAINRAVALYRHLAGIPGDREPPAAR